MNRQIWKFLTSLRLTVTCLSFSIVLVFIGTVAQADEGLYQAQERYFKDWFIWGPTLFGHWLPILLPGGYLLGTTLLVNLICAHINRFQWTIKKFGIHLTHMGIVVLLVGQLATDMLSEESHLRLREGQTRNYTESHRAHELIFATDSAKAGEEEIVSIPEPIVAKGGRIAHPKLPFTVVVKEYQINGAVADRTAVMEAAGKLSGALATVEAQYASADGLVAQAQRAGEGPGRAEVWRAALKAVGAPQGQDIVAAATRIAAQPALAAKLQVELKTRFQGEMLSRFKQQPGAMSMAAQRLEKKEPLTADSFPSPSSKGSGKQVVAMPLPETKEMDSNNLPYSVVELLDGDKTLGSWLLSPYLDPQDLVIAGKTWRAAFRSERIYHPFSVKLLKTTHEVYRGTEIPKNFQSRVHIENIGKGETRDSDIYMNNPLRYEGLTFFQYQMGQDERYENVGTSTLQVVRNPSWLTPYLGCGLVAIGMIFQFMFHLVGFISKRKAV